MTLPLSTSAQSAPRRALPVPLVIKLCMGVLLVVALIAILAPLLTPYSYSQQNLLKRLSPPVFMGGDWAYPLGTDNLGRDMFTRLVYGIRTSIAIALVGTCIGAVFGTTLGYIASRRRGLVDETIMMMVDVQAALPAFFVAIACVAFVGNALWVFILLVSLEGWERYTRLVRGLVISEHGKPYVQAMLALGASRWRTDMLHVFPNISAALVVQATITFPWTILLETSLSFLGLGVQPPETSLGQMLGSGRQYLLQAAWIAVIPGMAIFLTTLSMSLFGDWLRDRLDPSMRGR
jgi:peptide/nickel transport system permease protein